jgi:hypothetical protein
MKTKANKRTAPKTLVQKASRPYPEASPEVMGDFIANYTIKVASGVNSNIINEMVEKYHTPKSIFPQVLDLTEKSIRAKIRHKDIFTGNQADSLLELQSIFELAKVVFGSVDPFITWLDTNDGNTGRKRMELIVIPTGRRYLKDELYRIAYGYVY